MDQIAQLKNYISQCLSNGQSPEVTYNQLLQSGWPQAMVDQAFSGLPATLPQTAEPSSPHRIRNGVLWILSPFICLFGIAILQFVFRAAGLNSPILNILSLLVGVAGVILIPLGFIMGIMKFTHH